LTTILACGFFAAISGSNSATVATMGKIMIPEMKKDGYPTDFSAATAAFGGTVGIIVPPSIIFIIYGVSTGTPVGDLFLAGIIPGFIMVACMCAGAFYLSARHNWGGQFHFSWRTVLRSAWDAKLAFGASIIILGGIYGGIFTPSEAGAIAVAYCLLVGVFVTRGIKIKSIPEVTERSATINGFVAPVVAMAIVFSQILSFLQLPQNGVKALLSLSESPMVIVGLMLIVLLIAGTVMECTPNVILLAPLLTPVAMQLGFDPVHWGVVMVVTLAIGFITPPVGLNLFVASGISGVSFVRIAVKGVPYFIGLTVALLLITAVPQLSLWLVR
ncbi:MAG: TRAP transporter large permease, partial [Chloroflexota bacterium]